MNLNFLFYFSVALHATLVNFVNIQIPVTLGLVQDVRMAERVRSALKMELPFSHVHVPLDSLHHCVKFARKMHVIRHHVNTVAHVI